MEVLREYSNDNVTGVVREGVTGSVIIGGALLVGAIAAPLVSSLAVLAGGGATVAVASTITLIATTSGVAFAISNYSDNNATEIESLILVSSEWAAEKFGFEFSNDPNELMQNFMDAYAEHDVIIGTDIENLGEALKAVDENPEAGVLFEQEEIDSKCFAAGTLIDMADGSQKPIETIEIGDNVLSYDPDAEGGLGALRASKVTRTMTNIVDAIIDFHGVKVTPGHATLCTDGPDKGRHVPLMDIIMADGAVADRDGALIRAATNLVVGSEGDQFISVAYITNKSQQTYSNGKIRLGTLMLGQNGGDDWRIIDSLKREGYRIHDDGLISKGGEVPHPLYWFGNLPRPADYILAKSNLTLSDIYKGGTDTVVGLGELPMRAGMTVQ